MPFTRTAAIYTVPDLTLGLTNVQGSSDGIRADASIAIYTTDNPTTAAASDSPAPGDAATAARSNHLHGMPASFTTFAAPSFTLGTSNVSGSGDSVHAGATLLAFDATSASDNDYAQSGAAGSAVVTSRRDHVHAMPAQPNLGSAMQNFVEGGLLCPFMLGPIRKGSFASGDAVGFGDSFEFGFNGTGGAMTQSTVITGGYRLTAGNADARAAWLSAGDGKLKASDDFTVVYRLSKPAGGVGTTYFGLATSTEAGDTSDNIIQFYWNHLYGLTVTTDDDGTQTQTTITGAAVDVQHTFRIDVTGDGGSVGFYLNGVLEATHTTTIPTSTDMFAYVVQKSNSAALTYLDVGDTFAWRTS